MKHTMWGLLLLVFVVGVAIGFSFGFGGDEDIWLCRDGVWIRHGKPTAPMPAEPCGDTPTPSDGGIACTMEAKQCPDGSYVGRTGPRCEFAPCPGIRRVYLYYYDPNRDYDDSGILLCSPQGLVAVARDIAITQTPIQDTVRLLLRGELTAQERARGITTEYPLAGLSLTAASLRDGVLTLTLDDSQGKTIGGSCRVGILSAQIEATAKQFDGVREVRFTPQDGLFQP
jgi:hypothetical protein